MNNDVISTDCASTDSFLVYDDQAKRAYRRWQHSEGALFADAPHIAIDCETMAINIDQPELIPALVIAAVSDGQTTRFLMPEDLELPAPGSALRSSTRSREATAPGSSETSQENPSDPCAANSPFPNSSIPSSGWGFGHPGRLDAVSLDAFGELFQAGDDEPEEGPPI
ncbi:MAG: hypothetical protein JJU36_17925 [Phycisphaeraceae bacterium]|nr:hypothetical protein [Phycisphaeraceae bacterium]